MFIKNKLIAHFVTVAPVLAAKTLPWVPTPLTQFTLAQLLNRFFKQELAAGALHFMEQRWIEIQVQDFPISCYISLQSPPRKSLLKQPQLQVLTCPHPHIKPEVTLMGKWDDLLLMMTQHVDPDTLFFRRKLTLRGDTELGLELKNFLDTIELKTHLPAPLHQWSMALADVVSEQQTTR